MSHSSNNWNVISVAESVFFNSADNTAFPDKNEHNKKVADGVDYLIQSRPTFAVIDIGRSEGEYSCIWVENGDFYGMGYLDSSVKFSEISEITESVTRYKSSQYSIQLILSFANKYPQKIFTSAKD